ncbi:MAG: hypothetical protein ACK4WC_03270 [Rubrimonas sp.]
MKLLSTTLLAAGVVAGGVAGSQALPIEQLAGAALQVSPAVYAAMSFGAATLGMARLGRRR